MRRAARGFSVIEALVALVIAAGAVATFYDAVATGMQLDTRTGARLGAASEAFALLDRVGLDLPLREGLDRSGRTRGHLWRVIVSSQPPAGAPALAAHRGELFHIYVSVAPEDDRDDRFELHAVRYRESPV